MNKQVTVQAVAGAIQATEGVTKSHQYKHKGARNVRSCGVYTQKRCTGAIELGYWTSGYKHHAERAAGEIALVKATLAAKGLEVIERTENNFGFDRVWLEVVAA